MEIYFADPKLKKRLDSNVQMKRAFGDQAARRIQQRLSEVASAEHASDLFKLPGRWHELRANRRHQLSGDLKHPLRLILEAANPDSVMRDDGGVNWEEVTEVVVVEIADTH